MHRQFPQLWNARHPGEPVPRVGSLRFRVRMDIFNVSGLSNRTPVFDALSIGVKSGRLLSLEDR